MVRWWLFCGEKKGAKVMGNVQNSWQMATENPYFPVGMMIYEGLMANSQLYFLLLPHEKVYSLIERQVTPLHDCVRF